MSTSQKDSKGRVTRRQLHDFPKTYWSSAAASADRLTPISELGSKAGSSEDAFSTQSLVDSLPQLPNILQFEEPSDLVLEEPQSGSEEEVEDDDNDDVNLNEGVRVAQKIEFRDPVDMEKFVVLYKVALPDEERLESLVDRGSWAIILVGGGHFVAALWDVHGSLLKHKSFHRYTSRKKQGGSQAAADAARGGGSRIRSAGATLRRYGEEALQKEVHALLTEWHTEILDLQCVFIRASHREKRDLLLGWPESPLKPLSERGAVRTIPISTRRPTLKEAKRVYEELSSVKTSSESLAATIKKKENEKPEKPKLPPPIKPPIADPKKPDVKGTDHLKKREEKPKRIVQQDKQVALPEEPKVVDEELSSLLQTCMAEETEKLDTVLTENAKLKEALFEKHYFGEDARFAKLDAPIGLVGVACICGHSNLVTWLLDHGVSPSIGASPYVATKAKSIRILLRKYWGQHPSKYDYEAAGIPSPLTEKEIEEMAEKERARRRKDREKKKEKAREKAEAAKPPEQRARELRAAAAEARMLKQMRNVQ